MANTYLQRNMANSLDSVYTISMWVKRCEVSRQQMLFSAYNNSTYDTECFFDGDKINWRNKRNGSYTWQKKSNAKFRDTNSFYHFVFQNNQSNRKIYVNGVEITSWETNTDGSGASTWNNDKSHAIGSTVNGGADHFNGIISHMHFASGTSLAPTVFGSVDSVTGEWQINTSPSFTPGANGFTILKDGNTITDQSANSNNFALGAGAITNTKDCASNIMATLNPLLPEAGGFNGASPTLANGATKFTTTNSGGVYDVSLSTIGMSSGKYYAECKKLSGGQGLIGIRGWQGTSPNNYLGDTSRDYALYVDGKMYTNNSETNIGAASYANNDIIGVAVDCDNWKIYFYKNGSIQNSSGYTIANIALDNNFRSYNNYFFGCCEWDSSGNGSWEWNFGNGFFGTTAITTNSGNGYAGAEGKSKFAYQPKSGHSALSTKGLNQ